MGLVRKGGAYHNEREAAHPYRHDPGRTVIKKDILLHPGLEGVGVNNAYPYFIKKINFFRAFNSSSDNLLSAINNSLQKESLSLVPAATRLASETNSSSSGSRLNIFPFPVLSHSSFTLNSLHIEKITALDGLRKPNS